MRYAKAGAALVLLLIITPTIQALEIINTNQAGENPKIYGDIIVFEQNNEIKTYNIRNEQTKTIAKGNNPAIFANKIVFQTSEKQVNEDLNNNGQKTDTIIQYYDLKNDKIINTELAGENPTIYSNKIAFSVNEEKEKIKLNNDEDKEDDIIMFYNIETKKLTNTKAAGNYPSTGPEYIIFETQEKQQEYDLNGDKDKEDTIIRTYQYSTGGIENTFLIGSRPQNDKGVAVFSSNNEIIIYNADSGEQTKTGLKGQNPAKYKNIITYTNKGKLYTYNLKTKTCASLDIFGEKPAIFESTIVFTTPEQKTGDLNNNGKQENIIRMLKSEDIDKDGVPDIIDNCMEVPNKEQTDTDKDCIGDVCDKEAPKPIRQEEKEKKIITQEKKEKEKTKTRATKAPIITIIILLITTAIFLIRYFSPRQRRKRKKSFGF